jgi:hypothetical protein
VVSAVKFGAVSLIRKKPVGACAALVVINILSGAKVT